MNFEKIMQLYVMKEILGDFQIPETTETQNVNVQEIKTDLKHDIKNEINERINTVDHTLMKHIDEKIDAINVPESTTVDMDVLKKEITDDLYQYCDEAINKLDKKLSDKINKLEHKFDDIQARAIKNNLEYQKHQDDVAAIVSDDDSDILPDRKPVTADKEYDLDDNEQKKAIAEKEDQERKQKQYADAHRIVERLVTMPELFDGNKFIAGEYKGMTKDEAERAAISDLTAAQKAVDDAEKAQKDKSKEKENKKTENFSELDDVFGDDSPKTDDKDDGLEDVFNM